MEKQDSVSWGSEDNGQRKKRWEMAMMRKRTIATRGLAVHLTLFALELWWVRLLHPGTQGAGVTKRFLHFTSHWLTITKHGEWTAEWMRVDSPIQKRTWTLRFIGMHGSHNTTQGLETKEEIELYKETQQSLGTRVRAPPRFVPILAPSNCESCVAYRCTFCSRDS